MKRDKKKVIIITIIIVAVALYMFFYVTQLATSVDPNPTNEYVAQRTRQPHTSNIDLPNGSVSIIEVASTQNTNQSWIGTNLSDLTSDIKEHLNYSDQDGVYVQDTLRDSPAQVAGILPGDILIKINDKATSDVLAAIKLIATLNPGDTYVFSVFRQGEYLNYIVTPRQHFS